MSINITVHSSSQPSSELNRNNPFASLESVRKANNEKRRRTRLEQVRQQSKEIAAKVRKNFQTARTKELANVEKLKQAELKSWKQKHISKLQADYKHCLEEVGEAHKAADAAEQCEIWFQEKKAAQQATALLRGKQAEAKLAGQIQDRESKRVKKKKEYVPSKSVGVQVTAPVEKPEVPAHIDVSTSSDNTFSAFEQFKKSSKAKSVPEIRVLQDRPLSPGFVSSDEELLPPSGKNKENIPSHNTSTKRVETLYYNPTTFTSPETLHNVPSHTAQVHTRPPALKPFTQVSDLIKRRRDGRSHKNQPPSKDLASYSSQKFVQFDDLSENTLSFPTSAALDRSILESPRKPVRKLLEQPKLGPMAAAGSSSRTALSSSKQSMAPTTTKTVGSSSTGDTATSSRVQYYDYNTKYRKEYDQPVSLVQRNERVEGELNAMQEASRLERLQSEMLIARRQPFLGPDRSKVALEKLQVRKDYENLKTELDKLVKAESQVKGLGVTSKPVLSEHMERQRSETRQKRMNEAVEDLLKQRVLITCPIVRNPPNDVQLLNRPSQINVAAGSGNAARLFEDDTNARGANSSDSCSTILLGHDTSHTRAGIPLPVQKEGDKVTKLKELLEQINQQKKLLTEELKKEEHIEEELRVPVSKMKSTQSQTDNGIRKMQQRQIELEEQQTKLHEKEREIWELEKQLKEKINRMEKSRPKVPIHIETKRTLNGEVQAMTVQETASTSSNDSFQSGSEIPVKIVITVNDKSQKKVRKTPKKAVSEARKRKKAKEVPEEPPKVYDKTPVKAKEIPAKPKEQPKLYSDLPAKEKQIVENVVPAAKAVPDQEQSPISSTTSTIYRQLPEKIDNRVGQMLKQIGKKQSVEPAPEISTEPTPRIQQRAPKHLLQKTTPPTLIPRGQNLNSNLMQYIVRLLGMSRQSIEQLGVSSSTTVSTPRDSVVNVSENHSSVEEALGQDQSRMDKLRRFIDENYNFLNEIDETLKEQELNGTMDDNISRVEDIWMKTLSRKERELRKEKPLPLKTPEAAPKPPPVGQSPPVKESSLKSILKSPKKTPSKVAKIITPQGHVEVINLSDRDEQEILEKYSQLTENCSKRITELSDMIQKVRAEKKKLIENSLSSSEQQESSTKYMDLPRASGGAVQLRVPAKGSVETSPQSAKDDPVSEEINNIFIASRQIGLSKDSGIAMSRPVTSSDFRDSPDARPPNAGAPQFESSEDLSSREAAQAAAFEPLLKDIPRINGRVPATASDQNSHSSIIGLDQRDAAPVKRTKPPVAITRYSPQLEEATAAHELSTILEVETPLASKTNVSIPPSERLDPSEQLLVEARDKLLEHARAIGYEGFPNYEEYVRQENLEGTRYDPEKTSLSRLNELLEVTGKSDLLRYQRFPLSAPEMNVTEETSKEGDSGKKQPELESNSSSSTSLPDVVAELKLRNIIDKSFNNSLDDSNRSTPDSGSLEIIQPIPKTNKSPSKRNNSKKDGNKSPDRSVSEVSESLERELNNLGLRWASSMLKKNQEVLLQDHSSSSSLSLVEDIRRASAKKQKQTADAELNDSRPISGKPLNLKEFIARELMIRTHSDLNSISESSSPCSLLLKSLLDISHINTSTPELLTHTTTDKNIQRTSTPVATRSSSSTPKENGGTKDGSLNVTTGLFSGESRISSVHMSSSSGGEHKLTVPNVRLNLDKYNKNNEAEKRN